MLHPDDLTRVSWCCVHFAAAAEVSPRLRTSLEEAGLAVFDLDAAAVRGKDDLLRAIAAALRFPDYFGMNWDALLDCLRDLAERVPADGHVLFVHAGDALWRTGLPWTGQFLEIWLAAAEEAAHDGNPLHLVFVSGAPPAATA
jgi:RNAse (barnase) inhibitor barstar